MLNHEEWLQWRRGGIGASDAPVIMGVSPWRTPLQLWEDKVFGTSCADNASMKRGREMEETARREFERLMNVSVFPKNCVSASNEWMRASLDGVDLDGEIAVEIKCPNREDHSVAVNKMIPFKYVPQLQHQLAVTGLKGMYYFSFDGEKGAVVEVARDDNYLLELYERELSFWNMVLNKESPKPTERDFVDMEKNHQWKVLAKEYVTQAKIAKEAEEKANALKEALKMISENKPARGHGVQIQCQKSKGFIDYSKVPELQGIDLEPYRKQMFTKYTISCI